MICWRIVVTEIRAAARDALFALMNDEEQARARRFVQIRDRYSFTAAHGVLRLLLGAMLRAPPRSLAFAANANGKPRLEPPRGVTFNMSHSGGIVLIGLSRGFEIGVDVEALRPVHERDGIVARYFHPDEAADFARIHPDKAQGAFFRCWSRKEAVVKALGVGMSLDLHRYRVTCAPDDAPQVLALEGDADPRPQWSLLDLDLGAEHVGAVAARRRPLHLVQGRFDPASIAG